VDSGFLRDAPYGYVPLSRPVQKGTLTPVAFSSSKSLPPTARVLSKWDAATIEIETRQRRKLYSPRGSLGVQGAISPTPLWQYSWLEKQEIPEPRA